MPDGLQLQPEHVRRLNEQLRWFERCRAPLETLLRAPRRGDRGYVIPAAQEGSGSGGGSSANSSAGSSAGSGGSAASEGSESIGASCITPEDRGLGGLPVLDAEGVAYILGKDEDGCLGWVPVSLCPVDSSSGE